MLKVARDVTLARVEADPAKDPAEQGVAATVFRLPLRNPKQAAESRLSETCFEPHQVRDILGQFATSAPECLLFLKNVRNISVYERLPGQSEATRVRYVSIEGLTPAEQLLRNTPKLFGGTTLASGVRRATVRLRIRSDEGLQSWLVHSGLDLTDRAQALAAKFKEIPLGAVALRLMKGDAGCPDALQGRAFCFLPLPVHTGLPVHLQGAFALSSNRRNLWSEDVVAEGVESLDGGSAGAFTKGQWNKNLLAGLLPQLYKELLVLARDEFSCPNSYYRLCWPSVASVQGQSLFSQTARGVLVRAHEDEGAALFWSAGRGSWGSSTGSVLLDSVLQDAAVEAVASRAEEQRTLPSGLDSLCVALGDVGMPGCALPEALLAAFLAADVPVRVTSPELLGSLLKGANLGLGTAELLVCYLLSQSTGGELARRVSGLKIIPLAAHRGKTGRFGTLLTGEESGVKGTPFVVVEKPEYAELLPTYHKLVDLAAMPRFSDLLSTLQHQATNVCRLDASLLLTIGLEQFLPSDWKGRLCAPLASVMPGFEVERSKMCILREPVAMEPLDEGRGGVQPQTLAADKGSGRGKKAKAKGPKKGKPKHRPQRDKVVAPPAAPSPAASAEVLKRLGTFWDLVSDSSRVPHVLKEVAAVGWPVVPTTSGFVVSYAHGVERIALHPDEYAECDRETLEAFSCLLLLPGAREIQTPRGTPRAAVSVSLAQCSDSAGRTLAALVGATHCQSALSPARHEALRAMLIRWQAETGLLAHGRQLLLQLPVFRTLGDHGRFVRIVNEGSSEAFFYAAPASTKPSDDAGELTDWEEMLQSSHGDSLLSLREEAERLILDLAGVTRAPIDAFLSGWAAPRLGDEALPRAFVLQAMHWTGRLKLWGNKRIMAALSKSRVVCFEDGGPRYHCHQFVDPSDGALRQISNAAGLAKGLLAPPADVVDDPHVLATMRAAGMASVLNGATFLAAAKAVAEHRLVEGGLHLCRVLSERYSKLPWSPAQFLEAFSIPFVPALDARQDSGVFPAELQLPATSAVKTLMSHAVKQRASAGGSKMSRRQGGRHQGGSAGGEGGKARGLSRAQIEEILSEELGREDAERRHDVFPFERLYRQGVDMIKSLPRHNLEATARKHEFVPLQKQHTTTLNVNAVTAWTQLLVLPPVFDRAPAQLLARMGCRAINDCLVTARHLRQVCQRFEEVLSAGEQHLVSELSGRTGLQGVVLCCATTISQALWHGPTPQPYRVAPVTHVLSGQRFVVLDEGGVVAASALCLDLADSLTSSTLSVPSYLVNVRSFLAIAGSTSINDVSAARAVQHGHPPTYERDARLASLRNEPDLSDFHLISNSGRVFFGHKLLFALSSEYWHTMLASGLSEASQAVSTIHLPEFMSDDAVDLLMSYVYLGTGLTPTMDVSERSVITICQLLQCSDVYQMTHLKSICEVWLTSNGIIDVFNVTGLLTHALGCNAPQLTAHCHAICREMFAVVSKTEEWDALPEDARASVLATMTRKSKKML